MLDFPFLLTINQLYVLTPSENYGIIVCSLFLDLAAFLKKGCVVMPSALRNFALTFVIAAVVFGVLAYAIVGFISDTFEGNPEDTNSDISTVLPDDTSNNPDISGDNPDDTTNPDDITEELVGETFNMLLIGSDYQPEIFDDYDYEEKWTGSGFPDKRNRPWSADMIILLRVDKDNHQFVICPIPRNTRVLINGENTKLGDVISEKGIEYLCGKVSELTGFPMDYYVHVPVGAIDDCINAIGTITFPVPEDMKYEDPEQGLIIDLKKGTHNVTGAKAAQMLRYVGYSNGNVGRMNLTVDFLKAMFNSFLTEKHMGNALNIYSALKGKVETNFTAEALTNNLDLIFSYSKFETTVLTYPGSTRVFNGVTYFEPSTSTAAELFGRFE